MNSNSITKPSKPAQAASYLRLKPGKPAYEVYETVRMDVETDGVSDNPFDPAQMDIEVSFTAPTGEKITVPAFWFQDYEASSLQPKGAPGWQVRFTPQIAGEWTAQSSLAGTTLKGQLVNFMVTPHHQGYGFVRISQENPHYLAFQDGDFYFPIGINMAWSSDRVLDDYHRWLDALSQNGGNFIRVWMASWSFGLEWQETGLGNYTQRLRQAWLLDQVFEMASERGVYIMLTLLNHGAYSDQVNPEWSSNPYNAALGGPIDNPQDFVTDPVARQYFERRLRYIAARWAYSTHLMAWEWWNEVDWTPIRETQLVPWIREMSGVLAGYDPYSHLVTSSFRNGSRAGLWSLPEISFAQVHDYSGNDPFRQFKADLSLTRQRSDDKPVILGEFGNPSCENDQQLARDGLHLHNGLWAAPFSGYSSSAMYWWWDQYIEPLELWRQFKGIADFLEGEDLAQLTSSQAVLYPSGASAVTLSSRERALVWIRSEAYNMHSARMAYFLASIFGLPGEDWLYHAPVRRELQLSLTGLDDGDYQVQWYSPSSNSWIEESIVPVKNGRVWLRVPDFSEDLALKMVRESIRVSQSKSG